MDKLHELVWQNHPPVMRRPLPWQGPEPSDENSAIEDIFIFYLPADVLPQTVLKAGTCLRFTTIEGSELAISISLTTLVSFLCCSARTVGRKLSDVTQKWLEPSEPLPLYLKYFFSTSNSRLSESCSQRKTLGL